MANFTVTLKAAKGGLPAGSSVEVSSHQSTTPLSNEIYDAFLDKYGKRLHGLGTFDMAIVKH
ncbi:hypothetical protein [uncultured Duncaniella sp.]|uniref:hypothetical protein n=1 Tax=uncultured Duncaniella sp. TaxID=2768039 RepID=UPI00272C5BA2|nr:hypothetical protein [uncultured Duncaniella sp.]